MELKINRKIIIASLIFIGSVIAIAAVVIFAEKDILLSGEEEEQKGFGEGKQNWGYVEVRPRAHIFWWLYHTTSPDVQVSTERPLAIWLQGGPGSSSTGYGNFEEFGPLDLQMKERDFTWVKDMNVLFIDSPVGTGFSYVENNDTSLLTRTNAEIASDLVIALKGFYDKLPEFLTVPLHIFSESYGGKVAVEFAYVLHQAIQDEIIKCDLKSVTSVDGWISPLDSVLSWAPFLLSMGFIDDDGYEVIQNDANLLEEYLNAGRFEEATILWNYTEIDILNITNNIDFYNVLRPVPYVQPDTWIKNSKNLMKNLLIHHQRQTGEEEEDDKLSALDKFMRDTVSPHLNIPDDVLFGSQSNMVFNTLAVDFMKDDIHMVEHLLNETSIEVHIITGQLDLIVATPGTVNWMNKVKWLYAEQYRATERQPIVLNEYIEGYVKRFENLSFYWVNRSGHMVPFDNPIAMDYILRLVTKYHLT